MAGDALHPRPPSGAACVPLTTISSLIARGGQEHFVARTFDRAFADDLAASHHLASFLIEQQGLSFLVSQFADREALERWRASPERSRLLRELDAHALRELCTIDKPVARIVVPSEGSGPKWKMLAASWSITFPLLLVLVQLLDRFAAPLPLIARIALTSVLMSVAITWVISPFLLRLTRTWRLKDQQMKIVIVEGGRGVSS